MPPLGAADPEVRAAGDRGLHNVYSTINITHSNIIIGVTIIIISSSSSSIIINIRCVVLLFV